MTWGRARATRSSSQTWTSTRSRIWCGMSTVAGEKCESTFYLNFFGCRVSDLPDKSDLLLSAADKYDIRWSWMVNVVPFSRIQFQSKTKNNYHPKYPPKTRERSPRKSLLAIVTYKSVILFSLQRLEGRMLSVIVSQPCRWPGDLIQLSWSRSATQVWCKTDGIFLGCWYFGPLRLAQGCGVENHCHIISSCPQGRGLQPARLEDKAEGWSFEDLPVSKLFLRDTLTCCWKCWSHL